jgi:hypothetical protein
MRKYHKWVRSEAMTIKSEEAVDLDQSPCIVQIVP